MARRHQEWMRRVGDVDGASQRFNRRPLAAMPQIRQNANRYPPIDHARSYARGDLGMRTVFPGTREQKHLFVGVSGRIRTNEVVNILADPGSVPQGGPVVDEDAHDGRVQSRP